MVATRHKTQQGITMIEILISVIILSIGLLGVVSLQLSSLRVFKQNYDEMKSWQTFDAVAMYIKPKIDTLSGSVTVTSGGSSGNALLFQQIKSEVPSLNKLTIKKENTNLVSVLLRLDTGLPVKTENKKASGCPDSLQDSSEQVYHCIYIPVQKSTKVI